MTKKWQTPPEPGWTPPPHQPDSESIPSRPTMVAVDGDYFQPGESRIPPYGGDAPSTPPFAHAEQHSSTTEQSAGGQQGDDDDTNKKQRDPVSRFLIEWVPLIVGAMLFAFVVRSFLFTAYEIPSQSMVPTLNINDRVIVNRISYDVHDINRGDVIVFDRPANLAGDTDVLIKRVVGLPGETVTLRDGKVYIDDKLMVESYIAEQDSTFSLGPLPGCEQESNNVCTVPEGHILVMGDNRYKSSDGRVFGPIPVDDVVGRAFTKIWPLNDIGGL